MTCATCGREFGWHATSCPRGPSFTLGLGTVPLVRADVDDLSDCAIEGMAALTLQETPIPRGG